MPMKRALQAILAISLAGVAFSGTLTYRELVSHCAVCTALNKSGTLFGYPVCVYGLAMYILVAVVAALGLRGRR